METVKREPNVKGTEIPEYDKFQVSFNSDGHLVFRFNTPAMNGSRFNADTKEITPVSKPETDVLIILKADETRKTIAFIKNALSNTGSGIL